MLEFLFTVFQFNAWFSGVCNPPKVEKVVEQQTLTDAQLLEKELRTKELLAKLKVLEHKIDSCLLDNKQ